MREFKSQQTKYTQRNKENEKKVSIKNVSVWFLLPLVLLLLIISMHWYNGSSYASTTKSHSPTNSLFFSCFVCCFVTLFLNAVLVELFQRFLVFFCCCRHRCRCFMLRFYFLFIIASFLLRTSPCDRFDIASKRFFSPNTNWQRSSNERKRNNNNNDDKQKNKK